jgi:hypothetical protein
MRLTAYRVRLFLSQVSGAIAQTMATYMTGHSMLTALFTGKVSSDQIAQCIVAATYNKISKAGNAIATLTEQEGLTSIYKAAHARCAPPARRRALLSAGTLSPLVKCWRCCYCRVADGRG